MFIKTRFVIALKWEQLQYPSIDKQVNILCYAYIMNSSAIAATTIFIELHIKMGEYQMNYTDWKMLDSKDIYV